MSSRYSIWKEIAWRPALLLAAIPWFLMGAYDLLKSEFLPTELQAKFQLRNLVPMRWWAWALMSLTILVVVILESAYRVIRKHASGMEAEYQEKVAPLNLGLMRKDEEIDALKQRLGECRVTVKVEAVYLSELRDYLGMSPAFRGEPARANYVFKPGYQHVIVDALFSNSGDIPTNIWNFKLSIKIPNTDVSFNGKFWNDQQDYWYVMRKMDGEEMPPLAYFWRAVDYEIDNDDLLRRGNPKQCWVHFLVKGLPLRFDTFDWVLEFRDGLREYTHPFTEKFIKATIEHQTP